MRWTQFTAMHPMNFGIGVLNVSTKLSDLGTGHRYFKEPVTTPRCPFDGAMIQFGMGQTGGWPPEPVYYGWCPICLDEREW